MKRLRIYDVQVHSAYQVYGMRVAYHDMERVAGRTKTEFKRNLRRTTAELKNKHHTDARHLIDTFFDD